LASPKPLVISKFGSTQAKGMFVCRVLSNLLFSLEKEQRARSASSEASDVMASLCQVTVRRELNDFLKETVGPNWGLDRPEYVCLALGKKRRRPLDSDDDE